MRPFGHFKKPEGDTTFRDVAILIFPPDGILALAVKK
jgi:hypothetical protein